jgi:hypothetical protein
VTVRSVDAGSSFASEPSQFLDARPDTDTLGVDRLAHQLCQVAIVFVGKVRFRHDGDLWVADP